MVWLFVIAAIALFVGGIAAHEWLTRRRDTRAVLNHQIDTKPQEDAAASNAHTEAQHDATVVLRSSDDELRREVEELAARGRAGK